MAVQNTKLVERTQNAIVAYEKEQKREAEMMNEINEELEETIKDLGGDTSPDTDTVMTANNLTEANYGDYVDYGINLDGKSETYDWRVFYVGDGTLNGKTEKHVYLIAADYVPNSCKELQEAKGPDKANMIAHPNEEAFAECTSVWDLRPDNGAQVAYHCNDGHNALNSEKTQCSFPDLFIPNGIHCNTRYYCSDHVGTGEIGQPFENSRCASALQCTENWSSFKNGAVGQTNADAQYVEYAIGGPTLEMWVESWNQKHGDDDIKDGKTGKTLYVNGDNPTGYGYYVGEGSTSCKTFNCNLMETPGYDDSLYFPHKGYQNLNLFNLDSPDEGGTAECEGYWISSPSAEADNELISVISSGWVSWFEDGYPNAVRPIICLKSDVKLTKKSESFGGNTVWDLGM